MKRPSIFNRAAFKQAKQPKQAKFGQAKLTKKLAAVGLGLGIAVATVGSAIAHRIDLSNGVPESYTVKRGDTLWEISSHFLRDPWKWPEIWNANTQIANPHLIYPGDVLNLVYIEGQPRITVDSTGRIYRLSPEARVVSQGEAIDTIPLDEVDTFLSKSLVMEQSEYQDAPYVLAGYAGKLMAGDNAQIYARGEFSGQREAFGIYRAGDTLIDPETEEVLGVQIREIGRTEIETVQQDFFTTNKKKKKWKLFEKRKKDDVVFGDDVAKLDVLVSNEELRIGDRLIQADQEAIQSKFLPKAPEEIIEGRIITVEGSLTQVGNLDVVIISKGDRDGLEPGDVLAVFKQRKDFHDRIAEEDVVLPRERAGLVMVFRTFEKVSYALVMEVEQGVKIGDVVTNP